MTLEAVDGRLAVDAGLGLEMTTPATVVRGGRIAAPGRPLAADVATLSTEPVQLVVDVIGRWLSVDGGRSHAGGSCRVSCGAGGHYRW